MWFRYSKRKMVELLANSGDPYQTPYSVASDLGLYCLPVTHLGVSRLQWVRVCAVLLCDQGSHIILVNNTDLALSLQNCNVLNKKCIHRKERPWSDYSTCIYPNYWNRHTRANSIDPEQMPQNVASDQGLYCFRVYTVFYSTITV